MKIAIVYDLAYPFSIGGVEWRNFSLAKQLVLNGYEVHLFGVKSWKGKKIRNVSERFFIHGISSYKKKYFKGKRQIFEPLKYSFFLFFELIKHDFDIIDVSAFPYFTVFSCKLYSIIKKKSLIITWHEVWDDYWNEYNSTIAPLGKIIEKIVAKMSKKNVCVSKLTSKRLHKIGTKKKHIKTIENWVEIEEIKKIKPLKKKYDIISVGRHMKHKNFDLLIKTCSILAKKIPDLKVLIIGEGPETIPLLNLRKSLNLEKNVEMLSFSKSKEQLYRYMKSSKLFVLLSELEGFSITTFEAIACGLPVLTLDSKKNALKDYLPDEYICNKINLYDKLKKILQSKTKYNPKFYKNIQQVRLIEKYYRKSLQNES